MDNLDKVIEAANTLGHLLRQNEIVKRYQSLAEQIENDTEAREMLEELGQVADELRAKEQSGGVIEVDEKKRMRELEEKIQAHPLISDFIATQSYYMSLMSQVNQSIAEPQGEPPRDSLIVTPDEGSKIILPK